MTPQRALSVPTSPGFPASPLMLCDRLITLAQDADRAGLGLTADRLVRLAETVLEERPGANKN